MNVTRHASTRARAPRRPSVPDDDLQPLVPAYSAVYDILRTHMLGRPLDELAALIAMKVVAITWKQVTEAVPELLERAS